MDAAQHDVQVSTTLYVHKLVDTAKVQPLVITSNHCVEGNEFPFICFKKIKNHCVEDLLRCTTAATCSASDGSYQQYDNTWVGF
jgi:hypothetical protein